jgi:bifunctional non-homologous end joining protein LigD
VTEFLAREVVAIRLGKPTLRGMPPRADGYIPPCIPTRVAKPPSGPDWVHEIKHDGYRLQVRREGNAVRLFTRRGYDWTGRYPAIAVTATLLRAKSFTLDGEAVVCGPDGVAIFDALHRRGTVSEAMLYAFDLLELDGEDLRALPLGDRKKRLARLLARRRVGIAMSEHTADGGATILPQACRIGLKGIVSKSECAQPVGPLDRFEAPDACPRSYGRPTSIFHRCGTSFRRSRPTVLSEAAD